MNVGQYRALLADLELKRAELTQVHDNHGIGYAKVVLANAKVKIQAELDSLLSVELVPVASIVNIVSSVSNIVKTVGATEKLIITARMSDGTTRDVSSSRTAFASYKDYDTMFNNVGMFTAVDVSNYSRTQGEKFRVVKTSVGWSVYDTLGTDGLEAVQALDTSSAPIPNTFDIVDINGVPIGVRFTTDGNESKGDNWNVEVTVSITGTMYTSGNPAVVTVSSEGLVTAVSAGSTNITISNGSNSIIIPVTVT